MQMKALEIYQQDMEAREAGGEVMPRQQYYILLRDALHDELMRDGYCELLERLYLAHRAGEITKLYVVDYAALMECHSMIVYGREMRDCTVHIPHLTLRGEKARWPMLELPGTHMVPFTREVYSSLRELRSVSRQMVGARDESFAEGGEGASMREVENIRALNKLLDERCTALQQERDELLTRVRDLEEGVISEQVHYAIEARRIREEEALQALYAQKRADADAAFREEYARLLREQQTRQMSADRAAAELSADVAAQYGAVRRELAEDVRQLQETLRQHITRWEGALSRGEYRMLARSYRELYALQADGMDGVILECGLSGADGRVMAALTALQGQLHEQVCRLEQAMLRLGLTIIRPEAGEAFDPRFHTTPEADLPEAGVIERCACPGVLLAAAGEAVVRAEVILQ